MASVSTVKLRSAVGRWARDVHSQALDEMPERIRPYAPIDTGELRRSIRRDHRITSFSADRVKGRIVAPVIQATTTDQGSPAHIIRSRHPGGVLIFMWHGRKVHYRFVNHPGNKAKPWWERALRSTWGPSLRYAALRTRFRP